jgi:hypothetical protein
MFMIDLHIKFRLPGTGGCLVVAVKRKERKVSHDRHVIVLHSATKQITKVACNSWSEEPVIQWRLFPGISAACLCINQTVEIQINVTCFK